jgi:hypothetical protein
VWSGVQVVTEVEKIVKEFEEKRRTENSDPLVGLFAPHITDARTEQCLISRCRAPSSSSRGYATAASTSVSTAHKCLAPIGTRS